MNVKAEKWNTFLTENKITNAFQTEELKNEFHTVLYRTGMEIKGQRLPAMLVLDDSIYTMLQILVAEKIVTDANRASVEKMLNDYNTKFKVFKYYINANGDICLDSCIPSAGETFDCNVVKAVIDVVLQHLTDEYPKLMKEIWAN